MSSYYNQGVQVIIGNGQNFPGTPRISLIPFIQNAYDKGLLNFTVLPPGSISLAEIQDISTAKILGRSTAGSGVIEQISIGTGLSLSGGILSSTATATPGGSDTQIQYNNAGAFGGSSQLIFNAGATNTLDITGSDSTSAMNALRVRNSSSTNLMTVRNDGNVGIGTNTPAATLDIQGGNTIDGLSVRLTGQNPYIAKFYNNAYSSSTAVFQYFAFNSGTFAMGSPSNTGVRIHTTSANAGYTTPEIDLKGDGNLQLITGTGKVGFGVASALGHTHIAFNTTASTPSMLLSGTGFSGGTATTTKPTFLIEPTGTTSTGWATSGTKLGVNAESGFTGLLMDLELNGTTQFSVSSGGSLNLKGGISAPTGAITSGSDIVSGGYFGVTSKSWIRSATNGNWTLYNNATTDFGLLQFGGTTSSYPALKRNSTGLDVRLADDSGYAPLIANDITTMGRFIGTSWRTSASYEFYQPTSLTGSTSAYYFGSNTLSGTNTNQKFWDITSTINKTGTGSYSIIDLDVTQTSAPSGTNYLMNLKVGGDSKLSITNDGAFTVKGRTTSGWSSTYIIGTNSTDASINGYANNTVQIIDRANSTQENKSNALLNVSSTSKGFLPPRMTTTQRDAVTWVSGDAGMMIFNSTLVKLQVWNGTAWETITSI